MATVMLYGGSMPDVPPNAAINLSRPASWKVRIFWPSAESTPESTPPMTRVSGWTVWVALMALVATAPAAADDVVLRRCAEDEFYANRADNAREMRALRLIRHSGKDLAERLRPWRRNRRWLPGFA